MSDTTGIGCPEHGIRNPLPVAVRKRGNTTETDYLCLAPVERTGHGPHYCENAWCLVSRPVSGTVEVGT